MEVVGWPMCAWNGYQQQQQQQQHHAIFLLWTIFLRQDVLGFCERPTWTRLVWEVTPQDLELVTKEQSILFQNSVCRIYQCFTGIGLSKGCLKVLYGSYKVALAIAIGLAAARFLLPKLKLRKSTKSENPTTAVSVVTEMNDDYSHDMNKMLYKLVTNTSKMMKYMKRVNHHHKKEIKYQKLNKKRKKYEYDEDEQLFPVCLHNHSSSEDTT
ncbi:uncharacterized protein M6D78_007011 [Vipera latastei]